MASSLEKEAQLRPTRLWKFLTIVSLSAAVGFVIFVSVAIPVMISQINELRDHITKDRPHWSQIRKTREISNAIGGAASFRQGPTGRDGRDGRDGIKGDTGPQGVMGTQGPPGPVNPEAYASEPIPEILWGVDDIVNKSRQYEVDTKRRSLTSRGAGGAVYVRWGRTTCSNSSELLYLGVVGGSHNDVSGGGANYLCLPFDPEWGNVMEGHQPTTGIYGTEYQTYLQNKIFSRVNTQGESVDNVVALCAVCFAESRPSYLMIPAKLTCPAAWTEEYNGYLMSD